MPKTALDMKSLPKRYNELVDILPPRPVHTESEYEDVMEMIDLMAGHKLTKDQADYLDAHMTFAGNYEDDHHEVPEGLPIDALKVLMTEHGMSANELGRLLGDKPLGSRILNGQRELSKAHIRILVDHFKVSADVFI